MKYTLHVSELEYMKAMSEKVYSSNILYEKGDTLQLKYKHKAFPWYISKVIYLNSGFYIYKLN